MDSLTIFFGLLSIFPNQGLPNHVYAYLGLLPWAFFATALAQISASVLTNLQLVQKVYFPRLILPLSGILVPAVDFLFSTSVLVGLMVWYHVHVSVHAFLAPLFLLLLVVVALGVGAVFATITVRYRDVPYVIP